jgi:GT2 family glycosyltransferase
MKIAVLTLTRDRLDYTKHCFAKLREFAGCEFDHYVLDNGSRDGTFEWLCDWRPNLASAFQSESENIGISRGMNELISYLCDYAETPDYDVIVKFDNDCELTQPNTLRDVAQLAHEGGALLSPRILGLNNPPQPTRELRIGDETILDVPQIGGIFLAAPAWVYDEFRYSESNPKFGGDDVEICAWFRRQGGTCGYVKRLEAWHYETTEGQRERFPDYWDRKLVEMAS